MQQHVFVTDVANDSLEERVFRNYLQYEHSFVETAITLFGQALVKAPGLAQQRWLIGVLSALSNEQIPYFDKVFEAIDLKPLRPGQPIPKAVAAFNDEMLDIARNGSYDDIIVSMLTAEWMYATWCEAAYSKPISNQYVRDWVALHTDAAFKSQAAWLRNEIDSKAPGSFNLSRAKEIFARVLQLEIDFHQAAYE